MLSNNVVSFQSSTVKFPRIFTRSVQNDVFDLLLAEASVIYRVSMKPRHKTESKVETILRLIGFEKKQRLSLELVKSREVSFPFRNSNLHINLPS